MITDKQFMQAAAQLKHGSSADTWDNFVGAFRAYAFKKIGEVADADVQSVVLAQGFARQCKKFLQLLEECELPKNQGGS